MFNLSENRTQHSSPLHQYAIPLLKLVNINFERYIGPIAWFQEDIRHVLSYNNIIRFYL